MECISPLSMLAFRRFDMAWTVQLRRADRLEVLLFLLGSMAVSCSSSEQSFSRFMNSVKYLKQRKTFTDLLWLHLDTVLQVLVIPYHYCISVNFLILRGYLISRFHWLQVKIYCKIVSYKLLLQILIFLQL